jgi:hypothetical protein
MGKWTTGTKLIKIYTHKASHVWLYAYHRESGIIPTKQEWDSTLSRNRGSDQTWITVSGIPSNSCYINAIILLHGIKRPLQQECLRFAASRLLGIHND